MHAFCVVLPTLYDIPLTDSQEAYNFPKESCWPFIIMISPAVKSEYLKVASSMEIAKPSLLIRHPIMKRQAIGPDGDLMPSHSHTPILLGWQPRDCNDLGGDAASERNRARSVQQLDWAEFQCVELKTST